MVLIFKKLLSLLFYDHIVTFQFMCLTINESVSVEDRLHIILKSNLGEPYS